MEFGDELARIRRERGLTQVALAQRIGVHPSQLHRYEVGEAQPTLDVIRRLCVALSVSSDGLLFADDPRALVENRLRMALETTIYLSEHEQAVIAEIIENFVAARVARERPNQRRGPVPKKKREKD